MRSPVFANSPSRFFRVPLALALCVSVTAISACDKGSASNAPDGSDALAEDVDDGKTRLRYPKDGFEVTADMSFEQTVSGGASGGLTMHLLGTITGAPHGDGKLKTIAHTTEVKAVEQKGVFKPDPEEGEEPLDMAKELADAKSYGVMDRLGEGDEDATKALPENAEEEKTVESDDDNPGVRDIELGSPLFIPDLPKVGLELNTKVELPTEEDERRLGGGVSMTVEVDATYEMRKLEEVDGDQIATVEIESVGSGAEEVEGGQGPVFVAYDEETLGTIVFNVTKGVPVSVDVETLTEIHAMERTFETSQTVKATYTVGAAAAAAPAPAEAAPAEATPADAAPADGDAAPADADAAKAEAPKE